MQQTTGPGLEWLQESPRNAVTCTIVTATYFPPEPYNVLLATLGIFLPCSNRSTHSQNLPGDDYPRSVSSFYLNVELGDPYCRISALCAEAIFEITPHVQIRTHPE